MRDQNSSRSKRMINLYQVGMKSLIKEPVREAVREALVEEQARADEQSARTQGSDTADRSGDGSRILRLAMILPVLGLAVIGVVVKRRGLPKGLTGGQGGDEDDESASAVNSNQGNAADSEPTDIGSTGYDDHDVETDSDKRSRTER